MNLEFGTYDRGWLILGLRAGWPGLSRGKSAYSCAMWSESAHSRQWVPAPFLEASMVAACMDPSQSGS